MPAGRPSKYTPERVGKIIGLIQAGANRVDAARAAGIGDATLRAWMKRMPELRAQVDAADSASVAIAENRLRTKNPLAYLQAKRPLVYGNLGHTRTEVVGPNGGPVGVAIADADRDAILAAAAAISAATGGGVADSEG